MTEPNPDWAAWLARAETDVIGEDDTPGDRYYVADRPDRGWQRLGDVAAKVIGGLVGGGVTIAIAAAVLYGWRTL